MKELFTISTTILLVLLISACNLPSQGSATETATVSFDDKVAMTLTAISGNLLKTPSETPVPATPTETPPPTLTIKSTLTLVPSATPTLTKTIAPTQTQAATKTPIPKPGTIDGSISGYPYGALPGLSIVAFEQEPPYNYSYWITAPGETYFSMTSNYLIPGKYLVVAYDADGNSGGCPTIVTVKSEETVTCNITDWVSSFPAKPAGVPDP